MSSLEFDIDYSKKSIIDLRKYKTHQTDEEKIIKSISDGFERVEFYNNSKVSKELAKISNICQLNKKLLCLVYRYFESKNFEIENVVSNFDEDFEEQMGIIIRLNLFEKLKNPKYLFEFRRDFCCYLFLIKNWYDNFVSGKEEEDDDYY